MVLGIFTDSMFAVYSNPSLLSLQSRSAFTLHRSLTHMHPLPLVLMRIHNSTIFLNMHLPHIHCDFFLITEYSRNLLERQPVGIWKEEPDDDAADGSGDDEDEVELPADGDEGGWGGLEPDDVREGWEMLELHEKDRTG